MRFLTPEEKEEILEGLYRTSQSKWISAGREKKLYVFLNELKPSHVRILVGCEDSCNAALKFVNTVEKELNDRK